MCVLPCAAAARIETNTVVQDTAVNVSGRHELLVGSNPTVVTNVNVVPALIVRTEVVAEMSQGRSRGDVAVMRSWSEGPL